MNNFSIFNDEGRVVGDDWPSFAEAEEWRVTNMADADDCRVVEVCGDHPEHEAFGCEECNSDAEES